MGMIVFLQMALAGINVKKINNLNTFKRESKQALGMRGRRLFRAADCSVNKLRSIAR
jgi:hypothetical protein